MVDRLPPLFFVAFYHVRHEEMDINGTDINGISRRYIK